MNPISNKNIPYIRQDHIRGEITRLQIIFHHYSNDYWFFAINRFISKIYNFTLKVTYDILNPILLMKRYIS